MQFDEFLSVLDLLKDPVKYEAKIAELKAYDAAIQDSIKQLNLGKDISKTKAQADAALEKAGSLVDDASKKAEKILADAQSAFDKRHEELKAREVRADQAIADYNTIKNQQAFREDELRKGEKALAAAQAVLQKQQEELSAKQLEVDVRLAKLRDVMG